MTVSSTYGAEIKQLNAEQVYTFSFQIIEAEDLVIYEVDALGVYTLVSSADYTVVRYGSPPIYTGGQITFGAAHSGSATVLSVERSTPREQLVDYQPFSSFPAETHEFALDKTIMIAQELQFEISRIGAASAPPPAAGPTYVDGYLQIVDESDDLNGYYFQVQQTAFVENQLFVGPLQNTWTVPSNFILRTVDGSGNIRQLTFKPTGELELPDDLIIGVEVSNEEAGAVEFRSYEPQASTSDYGWHAFWSTAAAPSGVDSRMVIQPARDVVSGSPVLYSGDLQITTSPDGAVFHNFVFTKDGTIEIDGIQVVPPP
jgi:hypothetical protein